MSGIHVIFDLYGTLVDWTSSISSFIEKYLSREAVEDFFKCDLEVVSSGVYRPYKEILRECLSRVALKRGVILARDLEDAFVLYFAKSPLYPDVIYGIKQLRNRGFVVGVLSNTDRDLIKITLCGIEDLLDFAITAEDVKAYKPRKEAFTRAYGILGITPLDAVHVSAYPQYDLIPASELGARTVLLDRGYGYKWYVSTSSLVELAEILEEIL
ncbi:MAG: HAD hydrolase-like protein [Desulfurococcaceae archaeon]|nr:HAD hydrolase-like protein [Desulfurococcaceae archaeon]